MSTLPVVREYEPPPVEVDAVVPYRMHVSARYLELTRKKLELTRLPREPEAPVEKQWELGVPKCVLEPILDYWIDGYDWRATEEQLNTSLPQFRTTISTPLVCNPSQTESLRIHFVHKRSEHANAVPLLFCHSWPSSFIEVQRIIEALTDPHAAPDTGKAELQAFHVVVPSIPGFGFSDAASSAEFGLRETADVFDQLMRRLGYTEYVAHGTEWGFQICRALALRHPSHCLAVHTANPQFPRPTVKRSPLAFMKYRLAKITKAKLPWTSFGYTPAEVQMQKDKMLASTSSTEQPLHQIYVQRPQSLAFSLCDSPVGLLASVLDVIHSGAPSEPPLTTRPRSPFLSPVELEMEEAAQNQVQEPEAPTSTGSHGRRSVSPRSQKHTWSPKEILDWTMLQFLPGPEGSLRWLRRAHLDSKARDLNKASRVPLGISSFCGGASNGSPLMWGSSSWQIQWVQRHQRSARLPAVAAPDELVVDLREWFGSFLSHGKMTNLAPT